MVRTYENCCFYDLRSHLGLLRTHVLGFVGFCSSSPRLHEVEVVLSQISRTVVRRSWLVNHYYLWTQAHHRLVFMKYLEPVFAFLTVSGRMRRMQTAAMDAFLVDRIAFVMKASQTGTLLCHLRAFPCSLHVYQSCLDGSKLGGEMIHASDILC